MKAPPLYLNHHLAMNSKQAVQKVQVLEVPRPAEWIRSACPVSLSNQETYLARQVANRTRLPPLLVQRRLASAKLLHLLLGMRTILANFQSPQPLP